MCARAHALQKESTQMKFAFAVTIAALTWTLGAALAAQEAQPQQQPPAQQEQQPAAEQVSATGCLQRVGEGQAAQFVLVVSDAQRVQVEPASATVELTPHVNQRVELVGTAEQAENATILKATAVKTLAATCAP